MPSSYRELSAEQLVEGLPSEFQFAVVRPDSKGDAIKIGFSRLALAALILACCFNPKELISSWYVMFMALLGFLILFESSSFTTRVWGFDKGRFGYSSWPFWFKTVDEIQDVKLEYSLKQDCRTLLIKSETPIVTYYMSIKIQEISEVVVARNIPLEEVNYLVERIRLACFENEPVEQKDSVNKA